LVLAKPEYAFVPDVRLVLAQLVSHLILDGSDCIDFGIDTTLFDDCHNMSPSFSRALCACGFMCVYLDTGTRPRHRSQARQPLARLPRPRLYRPKLSATSTSAQRAITSLEHLIGILDSSSFCAVTPSTTFPLLLRGDVSSLVLLQFLSSLTIRNVPAVHDAIATTAGDVRVYESVRIN
jgi:hypothetical protein